MADSTGNSSYLITSVKFSIESPLLAPSQRVATTDVQIGGDSPPCHAAPIGHVAVGLCAPAPPCLRNSGARHSRGAIPRALPTTMRVSPRRSEPSTKAGHAYPGEDAVPDFAGVRHPPKTIATEADEVDASILAHDVRQRCPVQDPVGEHAKREASLQTPCSGSTKHGEMAPST